MERSLAALVACSIAFGTVAQASPISQSRIQELMASRDRQEVKLEALRSRDREILVQLGEMLSEKYGGLLEGSEMVFTRLVESGTVYYRLDFLGLKGKDRARALCEILDVEKCIALGPHGQMTLLQVDGDVTVSAMGVVTDNRPFVVADAPSESFNPKAREIESRVRKMLDPLGIFPIPRPDMPSAPAPASPDQAPAEAASAETSARPETETPAPEAETPAPEVVVRPRARPDTLSGKSDISIIEYFEDGEEDKDLELDMDEEVEEPAPVAQIVTPEETEADRGTASMEQSPAEDPEPAEPAASIEIQTYPDPVPEPVDEEPQAQAEPIMEPVAEPEDVQEVHDVTSEPTDVPEPRDEASSDPVAVPEREEMSAEDEMNAHPPAASMTYEVEPQAADDERPDVLILTPDQQVPASTIDAPQVETPEGEMISPDENARSILRGSGNVADVADARGETFLRSAFVGGGVGAGLGGRARDVAVRIPGIGKVDIGGLERAVPGLGGDGVARFPEGVQTPKVQQPRARVVTPVVADLPEVAAPTPAPAEAQAELEARAETPSVQDAAVRPADAQEVLVEAPQVPVAPLSRAAALAQLEVPSAEPAGIDLAQGPLSRDAALADMQARLAAAADAQEEETRLAALPMPRAEVLVIPEAATPQVIEVVSMSFQDADGSEVQIAADIPMPLARPAGLTEPAEAPVMMAAIDEDAAEQIALPKQDALASLPPMVAPLGAPSIKPGFSVRVPLTEAPAVDDGGMDAAPRISKSSGVEVALLGSVAFDDQFAVPSSVDFAGGRDAGRLQKMPDARPDLSAYESRDMASDRQIDERTARLALDVSRGRLASADLAQVPGMGAPSSDGGMAPPGFFGDEPVEPAKPRSPSLSRLDSLLDEADEAAQPRLADGEVLEERDAKDLFAAPGAEPAPEEPAVAQAEPSVAAPAPVAEATPSARPRGLSGLEALRAMSKPSVSAVSPQEEDPAPTVAVAQAEDPVVAEQSDLEPSVAEAPAAKAEAQRQALEILAQIQRAAEREREAAQEAAREMRVSAPAAAPEPAPSLVERASAPQPAAPDFDASDLRIELSYVGSREDVMNRAQELKAFFPPVMIEKGRFFGAAVPGHPGRYIVGIEAKDLKSRDDLIWYMEQMGVPWAQRAS